MLWAELRRIWDDAPCAIGFEPGVYCVSNLTAVLFSRAREFIDFDIPMEYFMFSGVEGFSACYIPDTPQLCRAYASLERPRG